MKGIRPIFAQKWTTIFNSTLRESLSCPCICPYCWHLAFYWCWQHWLKVNFLDKWYIRWAFREFPLYLSVEVSSSCQVLLEIRSPQFLPEWRGKSGEYFAEFERIQAWRWYTMLSKSFWTRLLLWRRLICRQQILPFHSFDVSSFIT